MAAGLFQSFDRFQNFADQKQGRRISEMMAFEHLRGLSTAILEKSWPKG
jgi:hypothetical protein